MMMLRTLGELNSSQAVVTVLIQFDSQHRMTMIAAELSVLVYLKLEIRPRAV